MIEENILAYILIAVIFSSFGSLATVLSLRKYLNQRSLQYKQLLKEVYWYKKALDNAGVGVYKWNSTNNKWYWSSTLFKLRNLSFTDKSSAIKNFISSIHPEDRGRVLSQTNESKSQKSLLQTEYRYKYSDGSYRWHKEIASIIHDDYEKSDVLFGTVFDITDEMNEREQLDFFAHYDSLTNSPNRAAFDRKLNEVLKTAHSNDDLVLCSFLDLNGFKIVNDIHGHQAGDQVLKEISGLFLEKLPQNMYFFRQGGDEFAILSISSNETISQTKIVLNDYINSVFTEFNSNSKYGQVGAAVGTSIYPTDAHSAKQLLSTADSAMYSAKRSGNFLVIYDYISA